ncbi:hypothetical protein SAMN06265365_14524 [Tistlia consotensis]|uniref:DUF5602 domain-containing protein n=1 Tax=Tistlia consotensis USBA 355 TaxID=560819 RepID=A0A1Y6CKT3_9PROT|nr:DUF5602 domain-containing protein [Tistlia consotensis]SMF73774.1 hypothetical protein SAMN05428998_13254 [Tistlia consotensis USBA 355]SNS28764.1 hypothetical protein SAMN06265365_14524 [Tistlia consotensis]
MTALSRRALRHGLAATSAILCAAALAGAATTAAAAGGKTYLGDSIEIGHGTAQAVVETDAAGRPQSIGISLSPGAIEGLPEGRNKDSAEGSWEFDLPLPKTPVATGYGAIQIDWNPLGHPPPGIYTVPHFDFHFYLMTPDQVERVAFTGPADPAAAAPDPALVPPGYKVIPETAVNRMGVHGVDVTGPEFHGKPFTATFVYGYYEGRLTFVEPMVTTAYLHSKPALSLPVKTPERYSTAGYYPTRYSVRYDAAKKRYLVELDDLKSWKP